MDVIEVLKMLPEIEGHDAIAIANIEAAHCLYAALIQSGPSRVAEIAADLRVGVQAVYKWCSNRSTPPLAAIRYCAMRYADAGCLRLLSCHPDTKGCVSKESIPGDMRYVVPETLARLRREAGISQQELASRIGVQRARIQEWETAREGCRDLWGDRLSKALGVPVERLYEASPGCEPACISSSATWHFLAGSAIKKHREASGLSCSEFGKALGLSVTAIHSWETRGRRFQPFALGKLERVLKLQPGVLLAEINATAGKGGAS